MNVNQWSITHFVILWIQGPLRNFTSESRAPTLILLPWQSAASTIFDPWPIPQLCYIQYIVNPGPMVKFLLIVNPGPTVRNSSTVWIQGPSHNFSTNWWNFKPLSSQRPGETVFFKDVNSHFWSQYIEDDLLWKHLCHLYQSITLSFKHKTMETALCNFMVLLNSMFNNTVKNK